MTALVFNQNRYNFQFAISMWYDKIDISLHVGTVKDHQAGGVP